MDDIIDPATAPRPAGYATVAPWLISADTAAELDFLAVVFGAVEQPGSRIMNGASINHVEVDLAGTSLLLFDAPQAWRAPGHLRIYVHDVDAVAAAAVAHGAELVTAPTELPFGDRVARFRDPQGHLWWAHQHLEDVPVDDLAARFAEPKFVEASGYVGSSLATHMDEYYADR